VCSRERLCEEQSDEAIQISMFNIHFCKTGLPHFARNDAMSNLLYIMYLKVFILNWFGYNEQ